MDKDYSKIKYIATLVMFVVIIALFFTNRINHMNDIKELRNIEPLSNNYAVKQDVEIAKSYSESSDNNSSDKKIKSTSQNVSKKSKDSVDFINVEYESENIEVSDTVSITNTDNKYEYNDDDLELLARLIYSEAGVEPYEGKVAVGNVVLYRAEENNKSISEVIYARGQFDGIHTDNFDREPNADSRRAAKEVLEGSTVVKDAYFYANLNLCSPNWAKQQRFIARIGDHWFFRKG